MLKVRSGHRAMGLAWISSAILTALIVTVFSSVSARVCTLMIDLDSPRNCSQRFGKFVLPPGDPCTCKGVRLGGHYHRSAPEMQGQDLPLHIDMLPEVAAEVIGRWFNCTEFKSEQSTPVVSTPAGTTPMPTASSCQEILDASQTSSGVYTILHEGHNMQVYCRMKSRNGYIVFQRRQDGSVSFDRTWQEYAEGFGNLTGEFWLGNEKLRSLTGNGGWELVITLKAFNGDEARAHYERFKVAESRFKLTDLNFNYETSEAGRAMKTGYFSTRDQDNEYADEVHCAEKFHGGWWYWKCSPDYSWWFKSNLNGLYHNNATVDFMQGIMWATWKGSYESLKGCEMMTRRKP